MINLKVLCDFVCRCLEQAHGDKMASIAFPALGTGFLGYNPLDSATTMLQCLATFDSMNTDTTLKEIIFVIYNKGQEWKHIKKVSALCRGAILVKHNLVYQTVSSMA